MADNSAFIAGGASGYWDKTATVLSPLTAGDTLQLPDGSASVPSVAFVSDTNTGIYTDAVSYGADNLAVSCGSSLDWRLAPNDPSAVLFSAVGEIMDAGAPILRRINRTDAHGTPANLGIFTFDGTNDNPASDINYAFIAVACMDDTAGDEDGEMYIGVTDSGVASFPQLILTSTEFQVYTGVSISHTDRDFFANSKEINLEAHDDNATFWSYSGVTGTHVQTIIESYQNSGGAGGNSAVIIRARSLNGTAGISFQDGYNSGSTWLTSSMAFSEATSEWDDFETNFGEVSLLNAINQAAGAGYWSRTATVLSPLNAGDLVRFSDGSRVLPAVSFVSDTNVGIYYDSATYGADNFMLSAGGNLIWGLAPNHSLGAAAIQSHNDSYYFTGLFRDDNHGSLAPLHSIAWLGVNSAATPSIYYADITASCIDNTAGAEEGGIKLAILDGSGLPTPTNFVTLRPTFFRVATGLDVQTTVEDIDIDAIGIDIQSNEGDANYISYSNTAAINVQTLIKSEQAHASGGDATILLDSSSVNGTGSIQLDADDIELDATAIDITAGTGNLVLSSMSGTAGVQASALLSATYFHPITVGDALVTISATSNNGNGEIYIKDNYYTGSTWAVRNYIHFSDSTAEWDDFRTNFGEVSLLSSINQAAEGRAWVAFTETFTQASASTFTVTSNATNQEIFTPGTPIKFRQSAGTWKYGITTAWSAGTVTFAGAEMLSTDDDELEHGDYSRVHVETLIVNGTYGNGLTTQLLEDDALINMAWQKGDAYLVRARHIHLTDDTTTNPDINVLVGGSTVFDADDATATTWQAWPNTDVNETNYSVNLDDAIELEVATAGATGDASDLTVQLTFVFE